ERGSIVGHKVLPLLRDNIKCGNSLIGHDIPGEGLGDGSLNRINPFDWESKGEGFGAIMDAGGFDAVIGNPPYVRPHNILPGAKNYYWAHYHTFVKKSDIYCCFIERGVALLKPSSQ